MQLWLEQQEKNRLPPMHNGAILAKENYGQDHKTLAAVTPIYRIKGYNPEGGNWCWGKYGAVGKVMASGKVERCTGCHQSARVPIGSLRR